MDNEAVGRLPACTAEACTWERTLGGREEDKAYAVIAMPDDGLVVAGNTMSFGTPRYDAWIARLDRSGETIWTRRLGGPEADHVYALAATADGGVLTVGDTRSAGAGESDVWLARLDSEGEVLWQRLMGDIHNDRARTALALADGGFVIGGFAGMGGSNRDAWVARLDAEGRPIWQRRFGGPGNDGVFHVALAMVRAKPKPGIAASICGPPACRRMAGRSGCGASTMAGSMPAPAWSPRTAAGWWSPA
jgi:hypothetical protein